MAVLLHSFGSIRGTNLRNNIARGQLWYSLCPSYQEATTEGACESFGFKTTLVNEVRFPCLKGKKEKKKKKMGGRVKKRRKKKRRQRQSYKGCWECGTLTILDIVCGNGYLGYPL